MHGANMNKEELFLHHTVDIGYAPFTAS